MACAVLVKRAKSHFENCNNGPKETPVQGDCSYIQAPRATGPECKKKNIPSFPAHHVTSRCQAYPDIFKYATLTIYITNHLSI